MKLSLLIEWSVLCDKYVHKNNDDASTNLFDDEGEDHEPGKSKLVVEKLSVICYGGVDRKNCIYFNVLILILFICSVCTFIVSVYIIVI